MEEFIVSARKYRPMTFDTVVGQNSLTTTLKNAIASGKLAHAYLFCGPRGVGKTTCARIFAKAINCHNPQGDGDACGQCESCLAFSQQRSLNIHELDAASNNSVEDIRELIAQVQIPPQTGKYKVFIIDEVHMLSTAAFNAFLKTLEEPPSYVIFILATTEKHKILPTILSRCQVYDFVRITTRDTIEHLMKVARNEGHTAEEEALNLIAQKADGGMRDALSIYDQMVSFTAGNLTYEAVCRNLNVLNTEYYFQLVEHILAKDVTKTLLLFDSVLRKGFDGGVFIGGLASHLRDLLMAKDAETIPLMEKSEQWQEKYKQQAAKCPAKFIYKAIQVCNDCDMAYRSSRNKRLQVEICLIQVEQLTEEDSPSSGQSPKKTLNPIFSTETPQATASAPQAYSIYTPAPAATPTTSVTSTTPTTPTPSATSPEPTRMPPPQFRQQAPVSRPVVKTGFGPSLRTPQPKLQSVQQTEENANRPKLHEPIDPEKMRIAWWKFIRDLPRDKQAMAQRMRDMRPTVVNDDTMGIYVHNTQVKQYMEVSILPGLLPMMRSELNNDFLVVQVFITEPHMVSHKYNKPELFARMLRKNSSLRELTEVFGLVID